MPLWTLTKKKELLIKFIEFGGTSRGRMYQNKNEKWGESDLVLKLDWFPAVGPRIKKKWHIYVYNVWYLRFFVQVKHTVNRKVHIIFVTSKPKITYLLQFYFMYNILIPNRTIYA